MIFLLPHVEVGSRWVRDKPSESEFCMQSSYRLEKNCSGGNLLKIHLDNCPKGLCEAKLDGRSRDQTEASKWCYNAIVRVDTCYQIAER